MIITLTEACHVFVTSFESAPSVVVAITAFRGSCTQGANVYIVFILPDAAAVAAVSEIEAKDRRPLF